MICPECGHQMVEKVGSVDWHQWGVKVLLMAYAQDRLVCTNPDCDEELYSSALARRMDDAIKAKMEDA